MIQKIRDLTRIKEEIDGLKKGFDDQKQSSEACNAQVEELIKKVDESNRRQDEFLSRFDKDIDSLGKLKEKFEKDLYDFNLLKGSLQKKIIDKFEEELSKELKVNIDKVQSEAESLDKVKEKMNVVVDSLKNLSSEVDKLKVISGSIKKEDFELTKFAKQLLDMDREKIELMRKIDNLERLVSKMRRSR